jgi:hypothetical protein
MNINFRKNKLRISTTIYEIHIFEIPEEIRKHISFSTKHTFVHFQFSFSSCNEKNAIHALERKHQEREDCCISKSFRIPIFLQKMLAGFTDEDRREKYVTCLWKI